MKKVWLWLSGAFFTPIVPHLLRVMMKIRIDINGHRIPLKISALCVVLFLVLSIISYYFSLEKKQ